MNNKLFKKLNEQLQINNIKKESINLSEREYKELERKVVFENETEKLLESLNFKYE